MRDRDTGMSMVGKVMTATDEYAATRRAEHATVGDSIERFDRDADAFTAGAQYALDRLIGHVDRLLMDPHTSEYLIGCASDILRSVHDGKLT